VEEMAYATVVKSIPVRPDNLRFQKVPAANYALRRIETVNGVPTEKEWHFFRVSRPKSGKWDGWTFLVELHGDIETKITGDMFQGVLSAIARDPKHFAIQFGKRTGICSICGKKLTDPKSVKKGIGPICEKGM
jgi:Family of unknown function (DUF6011)